LPVSELIATRDPPVLRFLSVEDARMIPYGELLMPVTGTYLVGEKEGFRLSKAKLHARQAVSSPSGGVEVVVKVDVAVLSDDEDDDDVEETFVPPLPVAADVYVHFELSKRHFSKLSA
jgi:hypothetical protein